MTWWKPEKDDADDSVSDKSSDPVDRTVRFSSKRPVCRHNRPISAHSQGVGSLRASITILVRRLESRARRRREVPSGSARRNISRDRKSTRLNSSHSQISYAVFCLKKKKKKRWRTSR